MKVIGIIILIIVGLSPGIMMRLAGESWKVIIYVFAITVSMVGLVIFGSYLITK